MTSAMTLDEAIADLSIQLEVKRRLGKNREADAIKLGIEALKAVKQARDIAYSVPAHYLPGETKE